MSLMTTCKAWTQWSSSQLSMQSTICSLWCWELWCWWKTKMKLAGCLWPCTTLWVSYRSSCMDTSVTSISSRRSYWLSSCSSRRIQRRRKLRIDLNGSWYGARLYGLACIHWLFYRSHSRLCHHLTWKRQSMSKKTGHRAIMIPRQRSLLSTI